MTMEITTYKFRRINVAGHAHEFTIYVACEELGSSPDSMAWMLAVEQANRRGPYGTKSLEMMERIIPASA